MRTTMPLPVQNVQQPWQAKFAHQNGTSLRLQCCLTVKDVQGRVAAVRLPEFDGWCLPVENMLLGESPDDAAMRVARSWFASPLRPRLSRILSFPPTGGDDTRWYLVFVYEAAAPEDVKATPDTEEMAFFAPENGPDAWAMSHDDVWNALQAE